MGRKYNLSRGGLKQLHNKPEFQHGLSAPKTRLALTMPAHRLPSISHFLWRSPFLWRSLKKEVRPALPRLFPRNNPGLYQDPPVRGQQCQDPPVREQRWPCSTHHRLPGQDVSRLSWLASRATTIRERPKPCSHSANGDHKNQTDCLFPSEI